MNRLSKKYKFTFLFSLVILGGLFFDLARAEVENNFQTGELLVKFYGNEDVYKIKVSSDQNIFDLVKSFEQNKAVEYVEPNYVFTATAFPNDPDRGFQGYLNIINAKNAWSKDLLIRETEGITRKSIIAILDTGVDIDHPDLAEKIWQNTDEIPGNGRDDDGNGFTDDRSGWNFIDNNNSINPNLNGSINPDAAKHGTIVAGVAAASTNNGLGISGSSWFSQIMPIKVLDSSGAGDVFSVISAIDYAIDNGADVINMSFVGTGFSQSLFNAIRRANDAGVLVVAAAGNTDPKVNGDNLDITKSYPVCYDGNLGENLVIGVASVSLNLKKSGFSNYGGCIDISAPGEGFYSTQVFEPTVAGFEKAYDGYWSGTSLSAPLVSGALATIKSLRPGFSNEQLKAFLKDSAKNINSLNPGFENKLGGGVLDYENFINTALQNKAPKIETGLLENYIVAGLGFKSFPQVKILKNDGTEFKSFYAYNPSFTGQINIAAGDVDGNGASEVVTAAGQGGGPHIRVFDVNGKVISQFFVYEEAYRGGINITVADIDGDNQAEIITGSGKDRIAEVKIYDYQGNVKSQFLAYGETFTGGVKVASGDVDGDGKVDIITGAGQGGGPHVRVFDTLGNLKYQFFAYNKNFKGGINVAAGDLLNNKRAEIVVTVEDNSFPTVRIFDYIGNELSSFFAYEPQFLNGVFVAVGDGDGDGLPDIITGSGVGDNATIRAFNINGVMKFEFNAHTAQYKGGVRVFVME